MNFECFFDIDSNYQSMFRRKLKQIVFKPENSYLKVKKKKNFKKNNFYPFKF